MLGCQLLSRHVCWSRMDCRFYVDLKGISFFDIYIVICIAVKETEMCRW